MMSCGKPLELAVGDEVVVDNPLPENRTEHKRHGIAESFGRGLPGDWVYVRFSANETRWFYRLELAKARAKRVSKKGTS